MITSILAQTIEPLRILTGDEVATPDRSLWVLVASFAAAGVIMLGGFFVVKRAGRVQADPEQEAWRKIAAGLGLRAAQRRTIERLALIAEIKPCALVLSRGAMERAVLLCVPQFQRAELQRACAAVWPEIEVPGAAGNLPTVAMPEIRPPRALTSSATTKRPRLRAVG